MGRDFTGVNVENPVLWNPRTGVWTVHSGSDVTHGTSFDLPVPGDYNNDGIDDAAYFRPVLGSWFVKCSSTTNCPNGTWFILFGVPGDIPVPADYNNDGFTDYGIWRPSNGLWYVLSGADRLSPLVFAVPWGQYGDCPVAARLNGEGSGPLELNVWRPANGVWYYGQQLDGTGTGFTTAWGAHGDIPFSIDADADGDGDIAVYRPSTGVWYGLNPSHTIPWGQPGDVPMPISARTTGFPAVLEVYRPLDQTVYQCIGPAGGGCQNTGVIGPIGSLGVVPLPGGTR